MKITATELKNYFGKYLKSVIERDEEIIITKNNKNVARLVPYLTDIDRYFTLRENALEYQYNQVRVSYEEFMQIYENSDSRMEFINGEIYLLSSPSLYHQGILGELLVLFNRHFKGKSCKPFIAPFDVHFFKQDIKDPDVMQPDLIVLCDLENNINEKGKYTGTPTLTLEVLSPSTRSKDMVYKLNTFMTSGVSEFWMIDPDSYQITIYLFKDYKVEEMKVYKKGEIATSVVFEGLNADVSELFSTIKLLEKMRTE